MKNLIKFMATLILFVSVMTSFDSSATAKEKQYTGEDIFKGFVFSQGEIGEKLKDKVIPERYKELNTEESKKITDYVVNEIKKQDKNYFKNLQKAVYKKDAMKVDQLLVAGGKMTKDILNKKYNYDTNGIQRANSIVAIEVAVLGFLVALVNVALTQIDFTPIAADETIDKETYINDLLMEVN